MPGDSSVIRPEESAVQVSSITVGVHGCHPDPFRLRPIDDDTAGIVVGQSDSAPCFSEIEGAEQPLFDGCGIDGIGGCWIRNEDVAGSPVFPGTLERSGLNERKVFSGVLASKDAQGRFPWRTGGNEEFIGAVRVCENSSDLADGFAGRKRVSEQFPGTSCVIAPVCAAYVCGEIDTVRIGAGDAHSLQVSSGTDFAWFPFAIKGLDGKRWRGATGGGEKGCRRAGQNHIS